MKNYEKIRKPIPFLEVWNRDDEEKLWFMRETQWVCEKEEQTRQWTVKNVWGKIEIF